MAVSVTSNDLPNYFSIFPHSENSLCNMQTKLSGISKRSSFDNEQKMRGKERTMINYRNLSFKHKMCVES